MTDKPRKDFSWLFPPEDAHNPYEWDKYWYNQLDHGLGPGLFDMFCSDDRLLQAANKYGLRKVLCVGNGISQEAVALSKAGLDVTAMDISPLAIEYCHLVAKEIESTERYFSNDYLRDGGAVLFVVGDLFEPGNCPGPYDVIIERRTVQDYPEKERQAAINCLFDRMAEKGIFLCHCHDNQWNPVKNPDSRPVHATEPLIEQCGIVVLKGELPEKLPGRMAMLFTSSG